MGGIVLLMIFAMLLCCWLSVYVWEFMQSCWDIIVGCYVDCKWLFSDSIFGIKNIDPVDRVSERMQSLILEIVKARYCAIVLNNPPMSDKMLEKRMSILKELETRYPSYIKRYSPTKYYGYDESMAEQAYGTNDWFKMKRTLSLTRPDSVLDRKVDNG